MVRIYNVHLDAIGYIRNELACDYPTALRVGQLYGFLEHLSSRGGAAILNQAAYSAKTGCHRDVIRKDLKTIEAHGWAKVVSGPRGTVVRLMGVPFDKEPLIELPTACAADAHTVGSSLPTAWAADAHDVGNNKKELKNSNKKGQKAHNENPHGFSEERVQGDTEQEIADKRAQDHVPVWRERPRAWNKAQKTKVRELWNKHRPDGLSPLADDGIDRDRAEVLARLMDGRGGFKKFVEYLPQVLDSLKDNPFWGDSRKTLSFDSFFGSKGNHKTHWAQQLDFVKSSCQVPKADKPALAWDELTSWTLLDQNLKGSQIIEAAVQLVEAGVIPKEALAELSLTSPTGRPH
jgi:hypothetical protein|tara:strand:+ start:13323 stop:14366 length:1044 start_codon:yes stop_codon:yes gene_type:complete